MTQKQAIQLFEERKVRTVWDDEAGKWYVSIVDVIAVLTESHYCPVKAGKSVFEIVET